ncbi:hypothetical protein ABW20_dc0107252 [Dactylellina cionopaga]|nr:hypothetical protein ABW20_dc0107252 [Dactylellina cionopaga]
MPGMHTLPGLTSPANPYFHGNNSVPYTPELAPTSPSIQPYSYSAHSPGGTGALQIRETVIIPVTEEENAMYLDRLYGIQSGLSSGGASPVSPTGAGMGGHNQVQRLSDSGSIHGSPTANGKYSITRRNASRGVQHEEFGTKQRPAEMAANRVEEGKNYKEEGVTMVVDSIETTRDERYGQVYPR